MNEYIQYKPTPMTIQAQNKVYKRVRDDLKGTSYKTNFGTKRRARQ